MALVIADRVWETTTTTGTGALTLRGATSGFQTFAAIGDGNTTYYVVTDTATGDWEVGIGTYTAAGTTLARTTVLESSNGDALVSFVSGTKNVICTYPAERAVYRDASSNLTLVDPTSITVNSASTALRVTQTGAGNAFVVEDSANPDSTPFVIDASGQVVVGETAAITGGGLTSVPRVQLIGGDPDGVNLGLFRSGDIASGSSIQQFKSRGTTSAPTAVASADFLGFHTSYGYDGTNWLAAVQIRHSANAAPSGGFLPGRYSINLSTATASIQEVWRISAGGYIGQNQASNAGAWGYRSAYPPTGSTVGGGFSFVGAFQSDMTGTAASYISNPATVAATYTLTTLDGFQATTTTVGIDSRISNYHAFRAINIQPAATLNTAFNGGLNAAADTTFTITAVERTANVATITVSAAHNLSRDTSVTVAAVTNTGVNATASITVVGSTTTFSYASVGGDIAPGADTGTVTFGGGKWNAYMIGSAPNYFAGQVIVGSTTPAAGRMLEVRKAASGSTTTIGFASNSAVQSDSTVAHQCFGTFPTTQAAAFAITNFIHYATGFSTVGSGSSITTHTGFQAAAQIGTSGAPTTAYGFRSLIASGTGKWSLYMDGTAANYFAGALQKGYTSLVATANYANTAHTPDVQAHGTSAAASSAGLYAWNAGATISPTLSIAKSRGAAAGTRGVVVSGDDLGNITFLGDDGTNFIPAAAILAEVDGTPGANDMPGRLVLSTTAGGAATPTERMRIDSVGNVQIGAGAITAGRNLVIAKNQTGATVSYGALVVGTIQSDVTTGFTSFGSFPPTAVAAFTLGTLRHFYATGNTIGSGSAITTQTGFEAAAGLTGATNNFGFRGLLASGAATYNLYMDGTAANYLAGDLGIGTTPLSGRKILMGGTITGSATGSAISLNPVFQSDVTTVRGVATGLSTQATSYTVTALTHFEANQGTIGAGSAVTTQAGFSTAGSLTGATTNYGFLSALGAASGRWNFYASGTAANYLAGDLRIGTVTQSGTALLTVAGDALVTSGSLGYATGSGGAVTQATSRTTGVTLNKSNGAITLVSAAGTTTWQTFTVTNSLVAATDVVHICQKSGTDLNEIHVTAVGAGTFNVSFRTTGGVTVEQPVFNFAVIKAVAA